MFVLIRRGNKMCLLRWVCGSKYTKGRIDGEVIERKAGVAYVADKIVEK